MDKFIARENIKHFRRQLENGVDEPTRATVLKLLVEEEERFGDTREELNRLDRHIARLSATMARHAELTDKIETLGRRTERAHMVLVTLNDLMATYLARRQVITAALADGKACEA